jgi:hypothetical protein
VEQLILMSEYFFSCLFIVPAHQDFCFLARGRHRIRILLHQGIPLSFLRHQVRVNHEAAPHACTGATLQVGRGPWWPDIDMDEGIGEGLFLAGVVASLGHLFVSTREPFSSFLSLFSPNGSRKALRRPSIRQNQEINLSLGGSQ